MPLDLNTSTIDALEIAKLSITISGEIGNNLY